MTLTWTMLLALLACPSESSPASSSPASGPTADATSSTGDSTPTTPGTSATPDVALLKARFQAAGFTVGEGRAAELPLDECCGWNSCFKWNPSSSYVLWFLPLAPGESPVGRDLDADGLQWHWRLRADEAVVAVITTPPELRYHSWRTYVHESWSDELQQRIPGFDNLGDTLNQTVLGTEGGASWEATTVIISAADAAIEQQVRDELVAAGFPEEWINTDIVPADMVELGLHDEADTVRMMHRVALFADEQAGADWLAAPTETVWRLTPQDAKLDLDPLPRPPFRGGGREKGDDESHLEAAVDELAAAIVAAHPAHDSVEAAVNVREVELDEDCWSGCNRDSMKSNIAAVQFPEGPDYFMVAFGANHHATGHAAYQNAIMFGTDNDDPAAWVDDRSFVGSARAYLPDHPDVDQLYAWVFSRDCDGRPYCSEIASGCPGVQPTEPAGLHFRNYLDPLTGAAPRSEEVLKERVLVFRPASGDSSDTGAKGSSQGPSSTTR